MERRGEKCFSDILANTEAMLYIIYPEIIASLAQ